MTDNTLAVVTIDAGSAVDRAKHYATLVKKLREEILTENVDYGVIPGSEKPSLLKPGAEKMCSAFGFAPHFELLNGSIERWDTDAPLFHYRYKCMLVHIASGAVVAEGIGSCNSMESKYRYRTGKLKCPNCGFDLKISKKDPGEVYCWANIGGCGATFKKTDPQIANQQIGKVINEDIFSIINTIDKMSQKRALVAAVLIATNASEFFTQDIEDLPDFDNEIIISKPKTTSEEGTDSKKKSGKAAKKDEQQESQEQDENKNSPEPPSETKALTQEDLNALSLKATGLSLESLCNEIGVTVEDIMTMSRDEINGAIMDGLCGKDTGIQLLSIRYAESNSDNTPTWKLITDFGEVYTQDNADLLSDLEPEKVPTKDNKVVEFDGGLNTPFVYIQEKKIQKKKFYWVAGLDVG